MTTLELQGIEKRYGGKQAVQPLSFTLEAGRIVGLAGDNGAGKTTLLRMLADIIKPTHGTAQIGGRPLGDKTHGLVSFMPDYSNLYRWMRVEQMMHWYADMFADFDMERARQLCERMEVDPKARLKILSKGYTERAHLMLTLSRRVPLYLLDEPLGGADPKAKRMLKSVLRDCLTDECTIFVSSHLLNDMETLFDEVLFMQDGQIVQRILADDIREELHMSIDEYYDEVMGK